jgi:hypothetical protein
MIIYFEDYSKFRIGSTVLDLLAIVCTLPELVLKEYVDLILLQSTYHTLTL